MENILTIAIPTYNRSKSLDSLLFSLTSEISAFGLPVTIQVCDNCSTDDTRQIAENYRSRFDFLSYHRNEENIGGTRNFGKVASLVSTPFFWWLGDDTVVVPLAIRHVVDLLQRHGGASFVFLNGNNMPSSTNQCLLEHYKKYGESFLVEDKFAAFSGVTMQAIGCISSLVFRTADWRRVSYPGDDPSRIYPQIFATLELIALPDAKIAYSHRHIHLATRADEQHNTWYLDLAPLSILLEFPMLQRMARSYGFPSDAFTFWKSWKISQMVVLTGMHPLHRDKYSTIVGLEPSRSWKSVLFTIFLLAPILGPLVRKVFKNRFKK